ncbi:hypothetical protein AWB69_04002 [Caballeronia udeis]|uniref:Uncharacterized protein n=1 Tax=Caballeronia udeis TaxID=1232866 RepID=A0A158H6M3_9BURK|nr:hypothetical protein AWB69_04002 [Caballeronia udeis]
MKSELHWPPDVRFIDRVKHHADLVRRKYASAAVLSCNHANNHGVSWVVSGRWRATAYSNSRLITVRVYSAIVGTPRAFLACAIHNTPFATILAYSLTSSRASCNPIAG